MSMIKVVKHDIRDYYYLMNHLGKWVRIDTESFMIHTKGFYKSCKVDVINGKRVSIYEY